MDLSVSSHCRRIHKHDKYVPPVRWYADTALAVGLKNAVPERLRFFIAADDPRAIEEFQVLLRPLRAWLWCFAAQRRHSEDDRGMQHRLQRSSLR